MKRNLLYILLILFSLSFSGCKDENKILTEKKDTTLNLTQQEKLIKTDTANSKSTPDYVPPRKGGKNRNWYYNKNRKLMNDTTCCFGRGMRHRHRHGWGWQRGRFDN